VLRTTRSLTLTLTVVAYSPWSNGRAERVNREVLKLLRILISQFRLDFKDWTQLLSNVQFFLNNTPRSRLGNRTADEVFMLNSGDSPLEWIMPSSREFKLESKRSTSSELKAVVEACLREMDMMHQMVADVQELVRQEFKLKQSNRKSVADVQYQEGDWVLVSRSTRKSEKLQLQWVGPFQVVKVLSPFVYRVRSIVNDEEQDVHACRIQLYANQSFEFTEEVVTQYLHDTRGLTLEQIHDCRWNEEVADFEFLCHWWGFHDSDRNWESFDRLIEDYPDKVDLFLMSTLGHNDDVKQLLRRKRGL